MNDKHYSTRSLEWLILSLLMGFATGCSDETPPAPQGGTRPAGSTAPMTPPRPPMANSTLGMNTPFIRPAIETPKMFSAEDVAIPDDRKVIGIANGAEARAYLFEAMSDMTSHVVNDKIAQRPVAVSYCDRTDCVRVFCGNHEGPSLSLQTGGFMNGELAIMCNGTMYSQSSKSIPLSDEAFVRTTWGEWKAEHSSTMVYVGSREKDYRK